MALRTVVVAVVAAALGVAVIGSAVACGSDSTNGDEATAVATGFRHTCAVTGAGGVKCWGANESGQLGNETTADSTSPVDVTGLASGVTAIAAGAHHTCAVTSAGGVKCWGLNDGGQLGNGTNENSSTPVDVQGLASGVVGIAAGAGWVCALTSAGAVKCWGWNQYGQLGDGNEGQDTNTPVDVSGLTNGVTAISANALHACALTTAGHVECWGSTFDNEQAPRTTNSDVPIVVSGLGGGATAITAGGLHACAINRAGGVECWGTNGNGQLGNGSTTDSDKPVEVSTLTSGVTALAVGSTDDFFPTHSCVLTSAGAATCWGLNVHGQLGNGSTTDSTRPVEVSGLSSGIVAVAVGGSHTCVITDAKRLKCWGDNSNGQLGDGSSSESSTPVDVVGF